MTLLRISPLAIILLLFSSTVHAAETRTQDKLYVHAPTDIILPRQISGYDIDTVTSFSESEFDGSNVSVRYIEDNVFLDIYLYKPDEMAKSDRELFEFERATEAIKHMANEGKYYTDLEIPNTATVLDYGLDNHPHQMVSTVVSYRETIEENDDPGLKKAQQESFIGVTFVDDFAVKIRHTFVLSGDEETDKSQRDTREEAINYILGSIKEADYWPVVANAIKTLKTDPTDNEAAAIVVGFAEVSRMLQVTVGSEWLPFLGDDDFDKSTSLLSAFVAGNIEAQYRDHVFESQNLAGVLRMLEAYKNLRKAKNCKHRDDLEHWIDEVEAGTFQLPEINTSE